MSESKFEVAFFIVLQLFRGKTAPRLKNEKRLCVGGSVVGVCCFRYHEDVEFWSFEAFFFFKILFLTISRFYLIETAEQ